MMSNANCAENYEKLLDENNQLRKQIDMMNMSMCTYGSINFENYSDKIKIECQKLELDRLVKQVNILKNDKYIDKLIIAMYDLCINDNFDHLTEEQISIIKQFCYRDRDPNPYCYISLCDDDNFLNYKKNILLDRLDSLPDYIVERCKERNMMSIIDTLQKHLRKKYVFNIDLSETDKFKANHWWHLEINPN